jgi:hypothetical protein
MRKKHPNLEQILFDDLVGSLINEGLDPLAARKLAGELRDLAKKGHEDLKRVDLTNLGPDD